MMRLPDPMADVLHALARDPELSAADLRVALHAVITAPNPGEPFPLPKNPTADAVGVTVRSAFRSTKKLQERGHLNPHHERAGNGARKFSSGEPSWRAGKRLYDLV